MSASALVLICFDPTIVYETGFLLSYLAVIGIVVFQQKITQLVYFRNKLMRSAWSLTAVSIAAQIATLPLTLYYFHQFPLYFLLTNLVLIPLSTVILYTALGFLALSWWGEAASFLGPASAFLTRLMNDITQWSASLPGHLIQDIPFNAFDACMTSLLLIFIMRFLLWKMPRAAIGVLITAIVWLTVTCIVLRMNEGRKEFCFHAIRHEDCVSITDGNSGIWLSSDSLFQDEKRVRRMLRPHAMQQKWSWGEERNFWSPEGHASFDFAGVRVMDARAYLQADVKEEIDVVWFTESSRKDRWDVQVLNSIRAGAVVMAWGISPQKKKFIRDHLPPELPVFDLAEGYVEVKEGRCIQAGSRARP